MIGKQDKQITAITLPDFPAVVNRSRNARMRSFDFQRRLTQNYLKMNFRKFDSHIQALLRSLSGAETPEGDSGR